MIIMVPVSPAKLEEAQHLINLLGTAQPSKQGVYHNHVVMTTKLALDLKPISHIVEFSYADSELRSDADVYYLARSAASPTHVTFIFRHVDKVREYAEAADEKLSSLWQRALDALKDKEGAAEMIASLRASSDIIIGSDYATLERYISHVVQFTSYDPASPEQKYYHDEAFSKTSELSIADALHLTLAKKSVQRPTVRGAWNSAQVEAKSIKED